MIRSQRTKASYLLLMSVLLVSGAVGMGREPEPEFRHVAPLMLAAGCMFGGWAAVHYSKAKGYPGWWGLLGMLPLFLLRDRHELGQAVRADEEAYLFPSDARVLRSDPADASSTTEPTRRVFEVNFGGAFSVDGFGFVRDGRVVLEDASLRYEGHRKYSIQARTAVFFLICIPPIYFGIGAVVVPAFCFVNYLWTREVTLVLRLEDITRLTRSGRKLRFSALDPATGKPASADFALESEVEANAFARELSIRIERSAKGQGRTSRAA